MRLGAAVAPQGARGGEGGKLLRVEDSFHFIHFCGFLIFRRLESGIIPARGPSYITADLRKTTVAVVASGPLLLPRLLIPG